MSRQETTTLGICHLSWDAEHRHASKAMPCCSSMADLLANRPCSKLGPSPGEFHVNLLSREPSP